MGDALPDGVLQLPAVEASQIDLLPAVETPFQLAIRRHPDPAAISTEVVTHRGDQAHGTFGPWNAISSGHTLCRNRPQFRAALENGSVWQETALVPVCTGTHGHQLDKAHLPGMELCETDKIQNLIVVETANQHGIDL